MDSLAKDITQIRQILQANSVVTDVDEPLGEDCLSLYENNKQHVNDVLLDLEEILGKSLSIGEEQQMYNLNNGLIYKCVTKLFNT